MGHYEELNGFQTPPVDWTINSPKLERAPSKLVLDKTAFQVYNGRRQGTQSTTLLTLFQRPYHYLSDSYIGAHRHV